MLSVEEILASPEVFDPLTRYQCCPPTCGAAAAILCSRRVREEARHLDARSYIAAQAMTTDYAVDVRGALDDQDGRLRHGEGAPRRRSTSRPASAPRTSQVVELHDCFTANELLTYEALGLCKEGEAEKFIWDGDNTYGGKFVTNPSGGLLSKGHPLGATGLAQCTELVWQLRGTAEKRQVEGAKVALQHNLGLGGACVVTLYGHD